MKFKKIKYIERKTKEIKEEKVAGEKAIKFLYYNPLGKLLLNTLVKRKFLTEIYGRKMNTKGSKKLIENFVQELNINMEESVKKIDEFTSFNDFFYRKLKENSRKIDAGENILVSPADSKVLIYENINEENKFLIKGVEFNLKDFFQDEKLAKKYEGGTFAIFRLAPADYHRFHFPTDGIISATKKIKGFYYSVSTHAIRTNFRIFCENKREYSILSTKKFGDIAMVEVGATMVGGITQTYKENTEVFKGQEKGYFSFGGSTIVLVFEKDKIKIDEDILKNTKDEIETRIYMGEKFANENKI